MPGLPSPVVFDGMGLERRAGEAVSPFVSGLRRLVFSGMATMTPEWEERPSP